MRKPAAHEVQVRLTLRVLASDEEEATRVVSAEVVEELTELLDRLHAEQPRLAGYRLLADELVDER